MSEYYDAYGQAPRSAYQYGTAAPAYEQPGYDYQRGARPDAHRSSMPTDILGVAKVIVAVLLFAAVLGVARVSLAAASVSTSQESDELTSQIESMRDSGNDMEVQQSLLTTSTRLKTEAEALGMQDAGSVVAITLGDDIVVCDAAGNLSLSGSLNAIAAQG